MDKTVEPEGIPAMDHPWRAGEYLGVWLVSALVGGGTLAVAQHHDNAVWQFIAYAILAVSLLFLLIGAVAKGVEAGIRAAREGRN